MAWPRFGSRRPPAGRSHARPGTALRPAYPEESSSAAAHAPDVVVEFAHHLPALVLDLVVVGAAEQGQLVVQRIVEAGAGVVLVPGVLLAAAVEADAPVLGGLVVAAGVGDPRRVDAPAGVEAVEVVAAAGAVRLGHRVQLAGLQGQALRQAVVDQGEATEAGGEQPAVAVLDHRGFREHVADPQHGAIPAQLDRAAGSRIVVLRPPLVVIGQQVDATAGAGTPAAAVQAHAELGEGVDADAQRALGEARGKVGHEALHPLLGVAAARRARLALAEVAVEVEVAQQQVDLAALDETFLAPLGVLLGDGRGHQSGAQQQWKRPQSFLSIPLHGDCSRSVHVCFSSAAMPCGAGCA